MIEWLDPPKQVPDGRHMPAPASAGSDAAGVQLLSQSTQGGVTLGLYRFHHAQREACEAYIASQRSEGWALVRDQYDDGGISGGTLERPGLQ
jgi:hypothetical protein